MCIRDSTSSSREYAIKILVFPIVFSCKEYRDASYILLKRYGNETARCMLSRVPWRCRLGSSWRCESLSPDESLVRRLCSAALPVRATFLCPYIREERAGCAVLRFSRQTKVISQIYRLPFHSVFQFIDSSDDRAIYILLKRYGNETARCMLSLVHWRCRLGSFWIFIS